MDLTTGERIKMARLAKGMTVRELAEKISVSHSNLSKWERGEVRTIKAPMLAKLAKALNVSPLYLMGLEDDEQAIINIEPLPEIKRIPILGEIACGTPVWAEENYEGEAQGPIKADFALRAKGDSMINARIFPGDLVFIKRQSDVESGEIAAVLIENEATLKRVWKYPNRIELRPENPLYEAITYEGEELAGLRILGKAVSFFSEKL